jgi:hypothetical protein
MSALKNADFEAVQFPLELDEPIISKQMGTVGVRSSSTGSALHCRLTARL